MNTLQGQGRAYQTFSCHDSENDNFAVCRSSTLELNRWISSTLITCYRYGGITGGKHGTNTFKQLTPGPLLSHFSACISLLSPFSVSFPTPNPPHPSWSILISLLRRSSSMRPTQFFSQLLLNNNLCNNFFGICLLCQAVNSLRIWNAPSLFWCMLNTQSKHTVVFKKYSLGK